VAESTLVIVPAVTPPMTPAASFLSVAAPFATFDEVTALLLSCTEPTELLPSTCPAQPVPPSAKNNARPARTFAGVNNRFARPMLPPSLVVAYRIWGDRHSPRLTLVADFAERGSARAATTSARPSWGRLVATIGRDGVPPHLEPPALRLQADRRAQGRRAAPWPRH